MSKTNPGVRAHATRRACCLGLTESLRNVNIVLTLLQLQKIVSYTTPCRSVGTSDLQKSFVGHPSSNSAQQRSCDLLATRSRSNRSSIPSTRMSSLDRFASALITALLGKLPGSDNFSFFETMCSSLSSDRTCSNVVLLVSLLMTLMIPCATGADTVCDVEVTSETSSVFCKSSLFSCLVPHQTLNVTFFRALP